MKLIGFGNLSIRNTYPFIASIAIVIRAICMVNVTSKLNDNNLSDLLSPLFIVVSMFTSESMIGFIELILWLRQTKKHAQNNTQTRVVITKRPFPLLEEQPNNNKSMKIIIIVVFIAILDGLFVFVNICIGKYYKSITYLWFQMKGFQILTLVALSYFCLKKEIYRHQWFSIVIIICGFFIPIVMEVIDAKIDYHQIFFYFLNYSVLATRDTTEKWLMETMQIGPTLLLFLQGLIGMIASWLLIGLSYEIRPLPSNFFYIDVGKAFTAINDHNMSWYCLGCFIGSIVYNLFYVLTKYYFSPILVAIGDSFSIITLFTISIIINDFEHPMNSALVISGYSVILIACLVYNEIIILYCCKLEEYTRKEIRKREKKETLNDFDDLNME